MMPKSNADRSLSNNGGKFSEKADGCDRCGRSPAKQIPFPLSLFQDIEKQVFGLRKGWLS
jgi:hypothetical protein